MFVFFAAYWAALGWPFALGLVLSIYVHEMGHVEALRRYGFRASAPMFIPGLGAIVRLKQHPVNAAEDARIGLAGPLWGLAAAIAAWAVWVATSSPIWGAVAHMGAWINLFNLVPVWQLDGGRGFRALSRRQGWLLVATVAALWFFTAEGLLLLIAIVAALRAATQPRDAEGDQPMLLLYGGLLIALALMTHIRVPLAMR